VVLLLRHASAGGRLESPHLDRVRSLDERGRADARRLSEALATLGVERIATSPYARCVETVTPLASRLGLRPLQVEELGPGTPRGTIVDALDALRGGLVVACTHREVFETLFGDDVSCEKGAAWLLARGIHDWRPVEYREPLSSVKHGLVAAVSG
jgi:8-oxo-dGTP diphosphatase